MGMVRLVLMLHFLRQSDMSEAEHEVHQALFGVGKRG